ncbi:TetR/AcrR family transcriptional regulator [Bailinhaonella thermotolerans]|uniref:TetR/AcrR family transcriptional regulator n=1 Tax=Bailinhaonella thermotolerans TaxID=1070861 RepID=A0A3A4AEH7_9ACTN|nr:TetR family transcriptional regulator [Bailinhaonella thermotolerans]RJL25157.1 TetR/AcrR family transcriptional regulator [Bailinhaonella thermotolerans]
MTAESLPPAPPPLAGLLAEAAGPCDETTERVLDAALELYLHFGLRRTTVEDVARRAGLSRVTVYRRFARKGDLTQAVILRELRRFLADFEAAITPLPTLAEQLVEGFAVTLRAARSHPLLTRMLATEPEALLPELTIHAGPFLALARDFLTDHALRADPALTRARVAPVAELFVRLALSLVLTPQTCVPLDTDEDLRAYARDHLAPLLAQ